MRSGYYRKEKAMDGYCYRWRRMRDIRNIFCVNERITYAEVGGTTFMQTAWYPWLINQVEQDVSPSGK